MSETATALMGLFSLFGIASWLLGSVIVGIAADKRGRNATMFFVSSLVLSPILTGLLVLALSDRNKEDMYDNIRDIAKMLRERQKERN